MAKIYKVLEYWKTDFDDLDSLTGDYGIFSSWDKAEEFVKRCFKEINKKTPKSIRHNRFERIYPIDERSYFWVGEESLDPEHDEIFEWFKECHALMP